MAIPSRSQYQAALWSASPTVRMTTCPAMPGMEQLWWLSAAPDKQHRLADVARQAGGPVAGYDGAVTERAEGSGMPGPQDHLAEQGGVPDDPRLRAADDPRETRVRPDDLQARLERLPTNHPSSPFRDDRSRKPPPADQP